jgi:hypothetical protein
VFENEGSMTRKRLLAGSLLLLIAAAALWLLRTNYYLAENGGAQLLCNADQCYLFVSEGKNGWRKTGLQNIVDLFVSFLGGAVRPTDQRGESIVLEVDRHGIQRYSFPGELHPDKVYRGDLYVGFMEESARRRLLRTMGRDVRQGDFVYGKWRGSNIEPINADEKKIVDTAEDSWYVLKAQSPQEGVWRGTFAGWTWVYFIPPDHPVRIDLQGGGLTFMAQYEEQDEGLGKRLIAVQRDNGQKTVLWSIDESPRGVTAAEYSRTFPAQP